MGFSREVLDSVLTRVVVGLKFLRMFQCRGSTELLAAVAQCRDLELFVIDGYEFGHEHTTPYGQSQAPFSKLRSFGINSIIPLTGSAVFSVLGAITSPSLVELQLQFQGREPGLVEAVSTLVADKWAGSLMKISFRFDITNPEDDVFGGIQPLLRCSRLEYLFLATGTRLNFLDGTYHALSLAWPNLSALSIRSEPENTPIAWVPPATWHTLQILSQNCPKLRHICIPVNFDAFCSQPGEKPQVPSTSVRTLDAAVSICSHPHSTAERLRKLFPALTALCYKDACLKEVRELLGLPVQCGNINEQEIHGVRVTFPFCEAAE
ncbi:hypothetical protein CALCODRAFT_512355 [Calocera cornea HHB12733]|uniref:F-box domain-containing protein n=1 Tax=Calocera cornea HHB12733 TaxID=1353952 RepID=A0A165D2Z0_9BASI|nr:hypothetical protein CALCODRAFT_512355 [Calocera cornea HHB12733]